MGYGRPSKQTVNVVGGRLQARSVQAGCRLWRASRSAVADSRPARAAFRPERHLLQLMESSWAQVHEVRRRVSKDKPYTLHSYRLDPCPSFLANGRLLRQAW